MNILFFISRLLFYITGSMLVIAIVTVAVMGNSPLGINLRMSATIVLAMVVGLLTAPLYLFIKTPNYATNKLRLAFIWLVVGIIAFIVTMPMVIGFLINKN